MRTYIGMRWDAGIAAASATKHLLRRRASRRGAPNRRAGSQLQARRDAEGTRDKRTRATRIAGDSTIVQSANSASVLCDPLRQRREPLRSHTVDALAPIHRRFHQSLRLEELQVLNDCGS